jgi:hypothetical protein
MQRAQDLFWSLFEKKPTAEEIAEKERKSTQALVRLVQMGLLTGSGISFFVNGTSTLTLAIFGLGAYSEIIAKKYYENRDPAKAQFITSKYSQVSIYCNMFHTIVAQPVAASLMEQLNEYRRQTLA